MTMYEMQFDVSSCSPIALLDHIDGSDSSLKLSSGDQSDDIIQSFIPVEEIWHICSHNKQTQIG